MESIYKKYAPAAQEIRQKHRTNAEMIKRNDCFTDVAKIDMQKKEKARATAEMNEVKQAYLTGCEEEKQRLLNRAFAPSASASQSEYLTAQNQADGMNTKQRTSAVENAISIGADDFVRAYGRSAYNCGDWATLRLIVDTARISISEPIKDLMKPEPSIGERAVMLTAFSL